MEKKWTELTKTLERKRNKTTSLHEATFRYMDDPFVPRISLTDMLKKFSLHHA